MGSPLYLGRRGDRRSPGGHDRRLTGTVDDRYAQRTLRVSASDIAALGASRLPAARSIATGRRWRARRGPPRRGSSAPSSRRRPRSLMGSACSSTTAAVRSGRSSRPRRSGRRRRSEATSSIDRRRSRPARLQRDRLDADIAFSRRGRATFDLTDQPRRRPRRRSPDPDAGPDRHTHRGADRGPRPRPAPSPTSPRRARRRPRSPTFADAAPPTPDRDPDADGQPHAGPGPESASDRVRATGRVGARVTVSGVVIGRGRPARPPGPPGDRRLRSAGSWSDSRPASGSPARGTGLVGHRSPRRTVRSARDPAGARRHRPRRPACRRRRARDRHDGERTRRGDRGSSRPGDRHPRRRRSRSLPSGDLLGTLVDDAGGRVRILLRRLEPGGPDGPRRRAAATASPASSDSGRPGRARSTATGCGSATSPMSSS